MNHHLAEATIRAESPPLPLTAGQSLDLIDYVSHDIRGDICIISDYVALLRDGLVGEVPPQQCRLLDIVHERSDDIIVLMDALLTIARLACSGADIRPQPCPVAEFLDPLLERVRRNSAARRLVFATRIAEGLPDVSCDPEVARRVLAWLWRRVARSTPPGELIVLEARRTHAAIVFEWSAASAPSAYTHAPAESHPWDDPVELFTCAYQLLAGMMGGRIGVLAAPAAGYTLTLPAVAAEEHESLERGEILCTTADAS